MHKNIILLYFIKYIEKSACLTSILDHMHSSLCTVQYVLCGSNLCTWCGISVFLLHSRHLVDITVNRTSISFRDTVHVVGGVTQQRFVLIGSLSATAGHTQLY